MTELNVFFCVMAVLMAFADVLLIILIISTIAFHSALVNKRKTIEEMERIQAESRVVKMENDTLREMLWDKGRGFEYIAGKNGPIKKPLPKKAEEKPDGEK